MTNTPKNDRSTRRPDCVTEIRIGNSVLVVSGYFKHVLLNCGSIFAVIYC